MPIEPFDCDGVPLSPQETDLATQLAEVLKPNRGKKYAVSAADIIAYVQENYGLTVTPERLRDIFRHITFTTQDRDYFFDREGDHYFVVATFGELRNYCSKVEGYYFFFDKHYQWLMSVKEQAIREQANRQRTNGL
jgi:hypothetical protein